jgi:hypothetical protein
MMTICKCQALVVAGGLLNPSVKLMAVIVPSGQSTRFMYGPYRTSWLLSKAFTMAAPMLMEKAINKTVSMTMVAILPP